MALKKNRSTAQIQLSVTIVSSNLNGSLKCLETTDQLITYTCSALRIFQLSHLFPRDGAVCESDRPKWSRSRHPLPNRRLEGAPIALPRENDAQDYGKILDPIHLQTS